MNTKIAYKQAGGTEITKDARLDLNSFELTYASDKNANKNWTLFRIANGATMTVGGGISGSGDLIFTFNQLNNNALPCLFDILSGGTLVLERGITIEIRCADAEDLEQISLIKGVDYSDSVLYPGFNLLTGIEENGYHITRIVVTGTTTMKAN